VGVGVSAVAIGEDVQMLEEEVEPWLLASGLMDRTPSGRVLGPRKV
jgi:Holliday junction DNA helicase RuvB